MKNQWIQKYENFPTQIMSKWFNLIGQLGPFEGQRLFDANRKLVIATLLENTFLSRDRMKRSSDFISANIDSIVAQTWANVRIFDWVSVKASWGPCDKFEYRVKDTIKEEPFTTRSRLLNSRIFEYPYRSMGVNHYTIMAIAKKLALEVEQEVLRDLRVNAGNVFEVEWHQSSIRKALIQAPRASWLVTSSKNKDILKYNKDVIQAKVYFDDSYPKDEILLGWKGIDIACLHHETGYFYLPYVPITELDDILDPDTFLPANRLMSRHGKKMIKGREKIYTRIKSDN